MTLLSKYYVQRFATAYKNYLPKALEAYVQANQVHGVVEYRVMTLKDVPEPLAVALIKDFNNPDHSKRATLIQEVNNL